MHNYQTTGGCNPITTIDLQAFKLAIRSVCSTTYTVSAVVIPLQITDPALIAAAQEEAARIGRRDWRIFLKETAERGARAILGLEADLTIQEAARQLSIHYNTVQNYRRAGHFPGAYYLSNRRIMIPMREVLAMKERTVGSGLGQAGGVLDDADCAIRMAK